MKQSKEEKKNEMEKYCWHRSSVLKGKSKHTKFQLKSVHSHSQRLTNRSLVFFSLREFFK